MAFSINISSTNSWNKPKLPNIQTPAAARIIYQKTALNCMPVQQQQVEYSGIMCECCSGKGWLVCEFCGGQKTNVKAAEKNRIYRRCPSCKAIGSVLCSKCKVYKCLTFPDQDDGQDRY